MAIIILRRVVQDLGNVPCLVTSLGMAIIVLRRVLQDLGNVP
jgi:hypothetical protein